MGFSVRFTLVLAAWVAGLCAALVALAWAVARPDLGAVRLVAGAGVPPDGLAAAVEARGGALLVVGGHAADAWAGGATHHLPWPAEGRAFVDALRFAERHVERVAAADRRTLPGWADRRVQAMVEDAHESGADAVLVVALSRLDLANAAHGRAAVDAMLEAAAGPR